MAKDEAKAFEYYEKGSAQGHHESTYSLAVCYQDGVVAKDEARRSNCTKKGWRSVTRRRSTTLGIATSMVSACKRTNAARSSCTSNRRGGSTVGMFNLGWCYEFGVWVPMSKDDALFVVPHGRRQRTQGLVGADPPVGSGKMMRVADADFRRSGN